MSSSKKRSTAALVVDPPAPESSSVRTAPANDITPPADLPADLAVVEVAEPMLELAPPIAAEPPAAAESTAAAEPLAALEPLGTAEPPAPAEPVPLDEEPTSPVNYDDEGLGEVLIEGRIYRFDSGKQGSALCLSARQEGVWHWSYLGELRWDGRDLRSKRLDRQLLTQLSESLRQLAAGS